MRDMYCFVICTAAQFVLLTDDKFEDEIGGYFSTNGAGGTYNTWWSTFKTTTTKTTSKYLVNDTGLILQVTMEGVN